jgi:predicted  nucleic acid-binding Zn-ribbon protein
MTPQTHSALKELQQMDQEIASIQSIVGTFDAKIDEVAAPLQNLEKEVKALQARLQEVALEENRIELSIEERRVRAAKLEERMNSVRNVREEAAVHAELEMVKRALENDEQEALSLLDQIRRMEERRTEHEVAYEELLAEVDPRRLELSEEKETAEARLEELLSKRDSFAAGIDAAERRVYESIMAGARDVAVAELTDDGACGNCFSVIPLQVQNEIRHSAGMIRCEGCGVILTPESEEGMAKAQEEAARIEEALRASEEARDAERAETVAQDEAELVADTEPEAPVVEEVVEVEAASEGAADLQYLVEEVADDVAELLAEVAEEVAAAEPVEEAVEAVAEEAEPVEEAEPAVEDAVVEVAPEATASSEEEPEGSAEATEDDEESKEGAADA